MTRLKRYGKVDKKIIRKGRRRKDMDTEEKILVADSEPDFLRMARHAMEMKGYKVITTSSRAEGLRKASEENPALIIIGALEPRGDAFGLHREVRESSDTAHIPMLVVDVRPEDHLRKGWTRAEGLQMDADDYVTRPIEPPELLRCVERVLKGTAESMPVKTERFSRGLSEVSLRIEGIKKSLAK
jgi:DNA-binding response OmpR family regulator